MFARHPKIVAAVIFVATASVLDLGAGAVLIPPVVGVPHPSYHHDLKKNQSVTLPWGPVWYPFRTNALGFRDARPREVPLATARHRIVFLGDSFTEGVGVAYEDTFVGLIAARLDPSRFDVLNAAVSSYTPTFYHLKTQYLLETAGLQFDELVVFIDISDLQDELYYEVVARTVASDTRVRRLDAWMAERSFVYWRFGREQMANVNYLFRRPSAERATRGEFVGRYFGTLGLWTEREDIWRSEGVRGAQRATAAMHQLYELCRRHGIRLNIAVYPWPVQIRAGNLRSRQVVLWEAFAREREIPFLDLFPAFIGRESADEVIGRDYVPDDIHWSAAGHRRVAEAWLAAYGGG